MDEFSGLAFWFLAIILTLNVLVSWTNVNMVVAGINAPIQTDASLGGLFSDANMSSFQNQLKAPPKNLTLSAIPDYADSLLTNFGVTFSMLFTGLISFLFAWTTIITAIFAPLGSTFSIFATLIIIPVAIIECVALFLVIYRVAVIVRGVVPI